MHKAANPKVPSKPSFSEAVKFWFILGWISFGGTTGHITIMHDFLVEKKRWISNSKFYHALNACMVLPGPEAHQLAIYLGWKLHGRKGGIIAGLFFILPSMLILLALSIVYALYGNTPLLTSIFNGLKPAVLAIILFATWKVGKKALLTPLHVFIAVLAFVSSYFFHISMPYIIFGIIGLGIVIHLTFPGLLVLKYSRPQKNEEHVAEDSFVINSNQPNPPISYKKMGVQAIVFILLWLVPFLLVTYFLQDAGFWKSSSLLFTKAAFFTIGGSYTVIPYVANIVTNKVMWLSKTQMIDGFALAETTPGPLVIVLSYIGFMAGFNHFNGSLIMGAAGLFVASYFTFLPNFVLIFMGAPVIERSQDNLLIKGVLSLVTAAVVGVIINLAFYLSEEILFYKHATASSINVIALGWVLFSLILLFRFKLNMIYLVILSLFFGLLKYSLAIM